jgi:hypothetical protein
MTDETTKASAPATTAAQPAAATTAADFVRKVFRIGFDWYEQLGSLQALREAAASLPAKPGAKRRRPS